MTIEGVDGESKDVGHEDEIDVLSWSFGAENQDGKRTDTQPLSVVKWVDKATPLLLELLVTGGTRDGVLTVERAGERSARYLTLTLRNVRITSMSTGGSGGEERLVESVSIDFTDVEYEYHQQNADGSTAPPISYSYRTGTSKGR